MPRLLSFTRLFGNSMKWSREGRKRFRPVVDGMEGRLLMTVLPRGFVQTVVARGLAIPSGIAAAPDGRLFVLQQTGQVRVILNGRLSASPALTVQTQAVGERGLVGITLDPAFPTNPYIY